MPAAQRIHMIAPWPERLGNYCQLPQLLSSLRIINRLNFLWPGKLAGDFAMPTGGTF
jgi:murein endopeptidase